MKIPKFIWSVILFSLKPNYHDKPSVEIYNLIKMAELNKYEYLKEDHPFSDTIWDVCNDLKEINLEYNSNLKEIFFKYWKVVNYQDKLSVFKNVNNATDEKFTPEIKKYFAKNIINYPSIMELNRFRKEISQEDLKKALTNFYKQNKFFNCGNNTRKEDYWSNHISGKEEDKLLDLLELSGMKKEDLIDFNKIGFFNDTRQARYDKIIKQESNIPLLESTSNQVYLITIKINSIILLKEEKLGTKIIGNTNKYILSLIRKVMENEKVEEINGNINNMKFITENKEIYEKSLLKMKGLIDWITNNQKFLIRMAKENKSLVYMEEETKDLANKIVLNISLENKLIEKDLKNKIIKKI